MPLSLAQFASRQRWLEPVDHALNGAIARSLDALGPRRGEVAAWLHGDPLGHPLHVMLTDVPLGAWTTAMVMDRLAGRKDREPWAGAARGAVGVGIAGAALAAVAGLADWHRLDSPETRRIGLVHGLINTLGLAAFTISFFRRRRLGHGRHSALAGFALALTAARLGGSLVYQHGAGMRAAQAGSARQPAA
ncbi:MAG: DUF2231 domain-containing protein [Terriglobales bacterium]